VRHKISSALKTVLTAVVVSAAVSVVVLGAFALFAPSSSTSATSKEVGTRRGVKVTKLDVPSNRLVTIFGAISGNGIQIAQQITALDNGKDKTYILTTSPGGSVLTGAAILSAIEASDSPVVTICSVMCASMAALIHQFGDERYMVNRSMLMFHQAHGGMEGDLERMRRQLEFIMQFVKRIEEQIARRMGISVEEYKKRSDNELYVESEEAVKQRLADKLVVVNVKRPKNLFGGNSSEE
jgi:ATP-dependent Clp endopeptidase proteolytic subunit ClpP